MAAVPRWSRGGGSGSSAPTSSSEVGIGRPGLGVIGRSGEGGRGLGLGREGLERVGHRAGRRPWRALAAELAFQRACQCERVGKASRSTHGSRGIDFRT